MKKNMVLILALLLAGCGAFKQLDFSKVKIGMSKEDVSTILQKRPNNIIGAKQYPKGTMEVEEYYYRTMQGEDRYYWLYFLNDKLVKYETPELSGKSDFNPWQDKMDQAYHGLYQ